MLKKEIEAPAKAAEKEKRSRQRTMVRKNICRLYRKIAKQHHDERRSDFQNSVEQMEQRHETHHSDSGFVHAIQIHQHHAHLQLHFAMEFLESGETLGERTRSGRHHVHLQTRVRL